MGERGPVPKRADAKAGHRTKAELEVDVAPTGAAAEQPAPPDHWHPYAKAWYASLLDSGQSYFYERSDWLYAIILGEQIHRELSPKPIKIADADGGERLEFVKQPIPGNSLSAIQKGMTDLLVTEAARRRAQVNLKRAAEDDGDDSIGLPSNVISMADRANGA